MRGNAIHFRLQSESPPSTGAASLCSNIEPSLSSTMSSASNSNDKRSLQDHQNQNDRRLKSNWKDAPAFLDATASVSVSTFGGRRLPEVQQLYHNQLVGNDTCRAFENPLRSGGGKRSKRHLRRRTTAIESKKHYHRYPRVAGEREDDTMEGRTKKYMPYLGKTRKSQRKKHSLMAKSRLQWLDVDKETENIASTSLNDGSFLPKWLVTHLWHAKRFHMATLWNGWRIPLIHTNRGARAALRLCQRDDKVLMRDVTWERQPIIMKIDNIRIEADLASLLQTLQRICPELTTETPHLNKAFLCGHIAKEGVMHELDQFPHHAIGPVMWRMIWNNIGDKKCKEVFIEARCHPSIHPYVKNTMDVLAKDVGSKSPLSMCPLAPGETLIPKICFRLYGFPGTAVLDQIIQQTSESTNKSPSWEWDKVVDYILTHNEERMLPHGLVITIRNAAFESKAKMRKRTMTSLSEGKTLSFVDIVLGEISCCDPFSDILPSKPSDNDIILVYQEPRPLDCSANRAMSGWEVYSYNEDVAKKLWMALAVYDSNFSTIQCEEVAKKDNSVSCCAIGLVEEIHLQLECEPPLPSFPRDYIDTHESRLYWLNNNKFKSEGSINHFSWKFVRQLCDSGWGRIPFDTDPCKTEVKDAKFEFLVEAEQNKSMIMVRKNFGQPFVTALESCCPKKEDPTSEVKGNQQSSKHRRRVRSLDEVIMAPPLTQGKRQELCALSCQLQSTLSLPAVLMCHIQIIGNGKICPGDEVHSLWSESKKDAKPAPSTFLGKITAGTFSMSRGVYHGMGIVGALKLLKCLTWNAESAMEFKCGRVVQKVNNERSQQLAVTVKSPNEKSKVYHACLSVILD
jgi:hypothetical protein